MKLHLAVVMRKELIDNHWQSHRWALDEVVFDVWQFSHKSPGLTTANRAAICMRKDEQGHKKLDIYQGERHLTIYLGKKELVTLMTMSGVSKTLVLD